ncbi:unnamed protein product [Paramecium sonneborni]|uniref:EGF-like domain-containing protein n=1 Tax=Paramecium sonneborni TaxID=65129 RepID=A0A8S1L9Y1_9CILI|nr:unnamed protein product [Paramecium sonneborni]
MFLLFVIHGIIAKTLLKETNSLYEEWRQKAQDLVTRTPMEMMRQTLGLRSLDQDNEEQFDVPVMDMNLKHSRLSRMMEESASQIPATPGSNITINEYQRQGPLVPLKCYLAHPILINVTQHYCFKQRVTYVQYQEIKANNSANCTIRYRLHYGCLCPPDFSGEYCKFWNPIICDIEQPSQNCKLLVDENYYNNKIDGNPPCNQFRSHEFTENVRTVCYNYFQNLLNRTVFHPEENYTVIWSNYTKGISALLPQQYKYSAPIPEDPNDPQQYIQYATASEEAEMEYFKYAQKDCIGADTNTLCSSFLFSIHPYVSFINWTYLSKSKTIDINYNLSLEQMQGNTNIQVPIQINDTKPLFGRYSIEIGFKLKLYGFYQFYPTENNETDLNRSKDYLPHMKPKILFFEDQLYEEPTNSDRSFGRSSRVGLIIAIAILIAAILLIYKYRNTLAECCFPRIDRVNPEHYNRQKGCYEKYFDCFKSNQSLDQVPESNPQQQNQSIE